MRPVSDICRTILNRCQDHFPSWRSLTLEDVTFDAPKGFSSFTMAVRPNRPVDPPGAFYRQLVGKENGLLDFSTERSVFLSLGEQGIATRCHLYHADYRIEALYEGRTLVPADLHDDDVLRRIANQLYRLHQLDIDDLPDESFFELLHRKWGTIAQRVLIDQTAAFPAHEQPLCARLREITSDRTLELVLGCLPDGFADGLGTLCHNDTYHGNIMLLENGEIRLLDFEFSCRNHIVFDFANLFAETVMRHGLAEPPHFRIAAPEYTREDVSRLIRFYLDNTNISSSDRRAEEERLTNQTLDAIPLSDFMYAMAAIPLALEPIQKIRFLPYAHRRFERFLEAVA